MGNVSSVGHFSSLLGLLPASRLLVLIAASQRSGGASSSTATVSAPFHLHQFPWQFDRQPNGRTDVRTDGLVMTCHYSFFSLWLFLIDGNDNDCCAGNVQAAPSVADFIRLSIKWRSLSIDFTLYQITCFISTIYENWAVFVLGPSQTS